MDFMDADSPALQPPPVIDGEVQDTCAYADLHVSPSHAQAAGHHLSLHRLNHIHHADLERRESSGASFAFSASSVNSLAVCAEG
mmetsp:Transcript_43899/g.86637  ORF Transcript_43899/g.86637 Transcript_43899/m.86637 type:complete len:84 (+) Transcript_43899:463-714(+)